jgi:hypothetical protein
MVLSLFEVKGQKLILQGISISLCHVSAVSVQQINLQLEYFFPKTQG